MAYGSCYTNLAYPKETYVFLRSIYIKHAIITLLLQNFLYSSVIYDYVTVTVTCDIMLTLTLSLDKIKMKSE